MAFPRLSTFIIGLVWVSFFAAMFAPFLANMTTNYGVDSSDIDIETYNKLEELNTQTEDIQESASEFQENTGVFDVIGAYFSNGYKSMKVALQSLDIFRLMTTEALESEGLDIPAVQHLRTAIITTVVIFIIIGVLISAILKKDV